jgi:uncharacterized protein (DUF1778 family)
MLQQEPLMERASRLAVRLDRRRDSLIRAAAAAAGKTVTDFVLDSATAAAELTLLDQRMIVVPDGAYDRLLANLEEPARDLPGARRRLARALAERG